MRKSQTFPLTLKDELVDFTLTRNVWLTVNNNNKRFFQFNRSFDKFSLDIGIHLWENRFYDYNTPLDKHPDILSYREGIIRIPKQKDVLYYIGKCNSPFVPLSFDKPTNVGEGDCIIAVDAPLPKPLIIEHEGCFLLADQALQYLQQYFQKHFKKISLLFILQFVSGEKYTFFIQSSLAAVGLTTEMFKNKILTYHREEYWHIETVLHEALVNAITYGSQLDYSKKIAIAYEIGSYGLRVLIQGEGFDVKGHIPLSLLDKENITGRGIRLMKHLSSTLTYNKHGNALSLLFNFKDTSEKA